MTVVAASLELPTYNVPRRECKNPVILYESYNDILQMIAYAIFAISSRESAHFSIELFLAFKPIIRKMRRTFYCGGLEYFERGVGVPKVNFWDLFDIQFG